MFKKSRFPLEAIGPAGAECFGFRDAGPTGEGESRAPVTAWLRESDRALVGPLVKHSADTTTLSEQIPVTKAAPRRARRLAVLGDSTAVGLGDPVPGRGWRGVGPFVAKALGVEQDGYLNAASTGARMKNVRTAQLPAAAAHRPDVVLVIAGMNDTLRSDFDARSIADDLNHVVSTLAAGGATVVPVLFHDHGKVFRLPGALYRALKARIGELNVVIEGVAHGHGMPCLDLGALAGAYELSSWSVDRLHPSELGHRKLAQGLTGLLAESGFELSEPVSLVCAGGIRPRTIDHVGWLILKGIPWLWRRGRDLLPYAAAIMFRSMRANWRASRVSPAPTTVKECRTNSSR